MTDQNARREPTAKAPDAGSSAVVAAEPAAPLTVLNRRLRGVVPRTPPSGRPPIVLDVGKKRQKAIKALKRGRGSLMAEIEQIVEELREQLGPASGKPIVPLILIYRQANRRARQ